MYHVRDEYELLVHTYYEKLYRFIYGYCKNSSDAEDVVQVAYLRLLETDKKFESQQHVKNWLYQVAVNCARDLLKSRWHKREKMPVNYGQFACGILIRENHNPLCRLVMEDWWREVFAKSYRDQLSFMYCLWKNGLNASDVGCLEGDWSRNRDFWQNGHNP